MLRGAAAISRWETPDLLAYSDDFLRGAHLEMRDDEQGIPWRKTLLILQTLSIDEEITQNEETFSSNNSPYDELSLHSVHSD